MAQESIAPPSAPCFELIFRPSVDLITIVRRFVSEFYVHAIDDEDMASRLALATHELLENAAKYTTTGETYLQVNLDRATGVVTIRTRNRTDPARISVLAESFAEFATGLDRDVLYNNVLRRSALTSEGSGLGLARIRAEGEMSLELVVKDDLVEIKARCLTSAGVQS